MQDDTEAAYEKELVEAESADLSGVRDRNIIQVIRASDGHVLTDNDGNLMIMVIPGMVPRENDAWEKAFQLFLLESKEIVEHAYRIIYVHSGFSVPLWFAWWLLRLRGRVSRAHRKNLAAVSIVHPTMGVRLAIQVARAFVSAKVWNKVSYADRVEELWLDDVLLRETATRVIPEGVMTFETGLIEHAEVLREHAVFMGVPLGPPAHTSTSEGPSR